MINAWPIEIGSVVISKAGRDRGRAFLVVGVVDDDFASQRPAGIGGEPFWSSAWWMMIS